MAVAPDATASVNTGAIPSATPNWSHTCTGSNLALFVLVAWNSATTISSVTYNSVTMTIVPSSSATNGALKTAIYKLVAPATGAHTAQINFSASSSCIAYSISFTGADQTTPDDGANTGTGSSNSASTSVTTAADSDYVIDLVTHTAFTATLGGSQTSTLGDVNNSGGSFLAAGSRLTSVKTPAGAVAMTWTIGNTTTWAQSVAAVRAVQAVTGASTNPAFYMQPQTWQVNNLKPLITDY